MSDSMVTARMPQAKKDAGNRVLEHIGSNASQFINAAFDYLIQHGESPFNGKSPTTTLSQEALAGALAEIDGMRLPLSHRFASMSDDEIKHERLSARGLELGDSDDL